jgi:hypothetical protein
MSRVPLPLNIIFQPLNRGLLSQLGAKVMLPVFYLLHDYAAVTRSYFSNNYQIIPIISRRARIFNESVNGDKSKSKEWET